MKRRPATYAIAPHAKVTLSLRVLGTRDDGFHDLDALTVGCTAPNDELTAEGTSRAGVRIRVRPRAAAPADGTNLAVRAAEALLPDLPVAGVEITLDKRIPMGAGLGGGSADAAGVLTLLGFRYGIAHGRLMEVAAGLGSDVPFCVQRLPAWMRGRGERLDPVDGLPPLHLVIVTPPFGCSTPAVYRAWDELGGPKSERVVEAPAGYPGPFVNDLEPAAEHVEPRLLPFRRSLERVLGGPVLLCGSGSSFAAWFADPAEAAHASERAQVAFGDRAWAGSVIVD